MKIENTNYEGDWEEKCPYCGEKQKKHQVNLGTLDGITYIHRQPCEPEQKEMTRKAIIKANNIRFVISIYELGLYLWNKIPFKEEISLVILFSKRLYLGIRGWIYFKLKHNKKK